jgi:hypothetical protein
MLQFTVFRSTVPLNIKRNIMKKISVICLLMSFIGSSNAADITPPSIERSLPLEYYHDHKKSDEEITNDITQQLSLESGVAMNAIQIKTTDRVVYLSGVASSEAVVARIIQIARSAGYVLRAESTIKVQP